MTLKKRLIALEKAINHKCNSDCEIIRQGGYILATYHHAHMDTVIYVNDIDTDRDDDDDCLERYQSYKSQKSRIDDAGRLCLDNTDNEI